MLFKNILMVRNYFLLAFRRLSRNIMSSVIKLISLFIGMVCFSLIAVYVYFELSYDKFNKHADNIARVTMEYSVNGKVNQWGVTGTLAGPRLQRTFPAVKSFVRIINNPRVVRNGEVIFAEENFLFVDPAFLKIFTFPLLEGDEKTALDGPGKVILTRSVAKKYFGNDDPLGKNLVIGAKTNYTVTGIVGDVPDNSQVRFDFLVSFVNLDASKTEDWFPANYMTYLLLEGGTNIAELDNKIDNYTKGISHNEAGIPGIDYFSFHIEPLTSVHLHSSIEGLVPNTPSIYIYVLVIIAIMILIIACINYANITVAQASERRTETGIRKLMGVRKAQLFLQFIGESVILSILAALLSVIGAVILLPYFSALTGRIFPVVLLFHPIIIGTLTFLCILVSFIAGAYPALIISGYSLSNILKPGLTLSATGSRFRRSFIIFQFVIATVLIIATLIIRQQISYIQHKDLGYDKTKVIYLPIGSYDWPKYYGLKAALKQDPYIKEVSAANNTPVNIRWTNFMKAATETGEKKFTVRAIPVDLDFIQTLGIKIIAGSDFVQSDLQQLNALKNTDGFRYSVILNETAVREIGWTPEESIGRQVDVGFQGTVKAVVQDFNIASLHEPVMPLVIFLGNEFINVLLVKINGDDLPSALSSFKKTWGGWIKDRPFEYHFLDEEYEQMYKNDHQTAGIFSTFSVIAIMLACLGLFGIVAIMTVQRTKEIGIRKIMGATVGNIVLQLSADHLKPVLAAFIIAVPVALYFANKWLLSFAYHISITLWVFLISALFSIVISLATVSILTIKAALSNPADSLRNE